MRKFVGLPAFLIAVAAVPAAPFEPADPRNDPAYRELVAKVRADMFRAGDRVAGWDRGGANPDAELRAVGSDRFYYQMDKEGGVHEVALLTDRPIARIAPDHWRAIASFGSPAAPAENAVVQFAPFGPHHILAMRAGSWRRRDVDCIKGIAHAVLFAKPSAPAQPPERPPLEFTFRVLLEAAAGQTVCSRYEGNRAAGWSVRHFLPDGRQVAEKQLSRMRIVPAAPLDTLISSGD
ncbi:MAG TPA: hypothetical protein VF782_05320 [Allosphingosinicella sp.]|jgi:hypothetical protein